MAVDDRVFDRFADVPNVLVLQHGKDRDQQVFGRLRGQPVTRPQLFGRQGRLRRDRAAVLERGVIEGRHAGVRRRFGAPRRFVVRHVQRKFHRPGSHRDFLERLQERQTDLDPLVQVRGILGRNPIRDFGRPVDQVARGLHELAGDLLVARPGLRRLHAAGGLVVRKLLRVHLRAQHGVDLIDVVRGLLQPQDRGVLRRVETRGLVVRVGVFAGLEDAFDQVLQRRPGAGLAFRRVVVAVERLEAALERFQRVPQFAVRLAERRGEGVLVDLADQVVHPGRKVVDGLQRLLQIVGPLFDRQAGRFLVRCHLRAQRRDVGLQTFESGLDFPFGDDVQDGIGHFVPNLSTGKPRSASGPSPRPGPA